MTVEKQRKPVGNRRVMRSVPHFSDSRLGPSDKYANPGHIDIATKKTRDRHDLVTVTEKLDGCAMGITLVDNVIYPLTRGGNNAWSSPFPQHTAFAIWLQKNEQIFRSILDEHEIISGEWLALAHGTIYDLTNRSPFAIFDWQRTPKKSNHRNRTVVNRYDWEYITETVRGTGLVTVPVLYSDHAALPLSNALELLGEYGHYGATDKAEGVVYRVDRRGSGELLIKYVRHDKVDGLYMPSMAESTKETIWLWKG